MTEGDQWFDVSVKLYNEKIAEPVLWLGDDCHYNKAKEYFGDNVVFMNTFVNRPYEINGINYVGENHDFYFSKNYLRAKDRCLKMMDRLDLYGFFGRIDREVYFNKITAWTLKKIEISKPDFLLAAEAPHDHAKYIIYEICKFLKIPIYKFNTWNLSPLIYLQNMVNGKKIKKTISLKSSFDKKVKKDVDDYVNSVGRKRQKFEFSYMKNQKLKSKWFYKLYIFFIKGNSIRGHGGIKDQYYDIRHNVGMILRRKYNPINPFRVGYFSRLRFKEHRKLNLRRQINKYQDDYCLEEKFVYFPLHFEPERTTNPDGGFFHDQLIALIMLRNLVPKDIFIYLKEHPSQKLVGAKGSRGRSPLFYNMVKNISNVKIVDLKEDSYNLLNKSLLTATISGSIAFESALLGKKSIVFGTTWYDGCPNIFNWNKNLTYDEIISSKIHNIDSINEFLNNEIDNYCVLGFQNGSKLRRFNEFDSPSFRNIQIKGIFHLINNLIKTI